MSRRSRLVERLRTAVDLGEVAGWVDLDDPYTPRVSIALAGASNTVVYSYSQLEAFLDGLEFARSRKG